MTRRIPSALAGTLAFICGALAAPAARGAPESWKPAPPASAPAPAIVPAPPPPPPPPAPAPAEIAAPAPAPDLAPDLATTQREALFDMAFQALATGNLILAEQAFMMAATVPGDAAYRSVALSFAERVRRARAMGVRPPATSQPSGSARSAPAASPRRDNSGRVPLLLTTTVLGLTVYGWTLPAVFDINFNETPKTFVGFYMLGASSAFVVPYLATRGKAVSAGQANLAFYGGTRGIYLGVLTAALLQGNVGPDLRYGPFAAGLLFGSIGGLTGGYLFADRQKLTAGQARTMAALGDVGLGLGFGTGFLLDFDSADKTNDQRARRMGGAGLVGAAVGLTSGYILARRRDNGWGDGEVMRMAAIVGAWSGFAVGVVADAEKKPGVTAVMVGGLLGLGVGDRLVVRSDFSVGQSILVDLASVAGALAAAGTLYLVSPQDWSEKPFIVASAIGGIGGFGISYWALKGRDEDGATAALSRTVAGGSVAFMPLLGVRGERGLAVVAAF